MHPDQHRRSLPTVSPKHSIDFCPICGGGLCGVRVCGLNADDHDAANSQPPHGLVVCDECEAIWLEPDITSDHQYPTLGDARCPICCEPLWGSNSRWADLADVDAIGWRNAVNQELDRGDEDA